MIKTTTTRSYCCDRCERSPRADEPLTSGGLFQRPKDWQRLTQFSKTIYCAECVPIAKAYHDAQEDWWHLRGERDRELTRAANLELEQWERDNPRPVMR